MNGDKTDYDIFYQVYNDSVSNRPKELTNSFYSWADEVIVKPILKSVAILINKKEREFNKRIKQLELEIKDLKKNQ
jgi:hypothetical protein